MQVINKIIFNSLASRREVVLPGIGTLWVERTDVSTDRKGKIIPPHNKLFFTKEILAQATIIDTIISKSDVSREDVEYAYVKWVEEVSLPKKDSYLIAGICTINDEVVVASKELSNVLNPFAADIVELAPPKATKPKKEKFEKKSQKGKGLVWGVVVAVIIVAAAACYFLYNPTLKPVAPPPTPPVKQEVKLADTVQMSVDTASAEGVIMEQLVAQGEKRLQLEGVERFHLIAGVFSSEENARKQIEVDKRLLSFKCEVLKNSRGMFLISVGAFDSKDLAQVQLETLEKTISGSWIYREPK